MSNNKLKKLQAGRKNVAETRSTLGKVAGIATPTPELIDIKDELLSLIAPLKDEELYRLEENIKEQGIRDGLVVWPNPKQEGRYILVDGHNRFSIYQKLAKSGHKLDKLPITIQEFVDIEQVKDWIIENQSGRRNLTQIGKTHAIGLRYLQEKKRHGGNRKSSRHNDDLKKGQGKKTVEIVAERFNTSPKSVERASEFVAGLEKITNLGLKRNIIAEKEKIGIGILRQLGKYNGKTPDFQTANEVIVFVKTNVVVKPKVDKNTVEYKAKTLRTEISTRFQRLTNKSTVKQIQKEKEWLNKELDKLISLAEKQAD